GDIPSAKARLQEVVRGCREFLSLSAQGQSERVQLDVAEQFQSYLDYYLTLSEGEKVATSYDHVLAWKGAVTARPRQGAGLRDRADREVKEGIEEWGRVSSRLLGLAVGSDQEVKPRAAGSVEEVAKLAARRDTLERELVARSAPFRQARRIATTAE